MTARPNSPLRILHVFRAPAGGVFRHIVDLASGQADQGHSVGVIADSLTGGEIADLALKDLAPRLKLGLFRIPIHRQPHPSDMMAALNVLRLAKSLDLDVLHGHGAKGGVLVRMKQRSKRVIRVYTPHGGSLHYPLNTLNGQVYSRMERLLTGRTDLFLFESAFARRTYERIVGKPRGIVRRVFNGVGPGDFEPVEPADDATDLIYVGEFRDIKGPDLLIQAVAELRSRGRSVTLTLAGYGEDAQRLKDLVSNLNLGDAVRFIGHVKARYGFSKGRLLVVPSRGDSMPYIVIEAGAAGVPMIAANVGGIPEILATEPGALFLASNVPAMAAAIEAALADTDGTRRRAVSLRGEIQKHFSQQAMVEGVISGYRETFASR